MTIVHRIARCLSLVALLSPALCNAADGSDTSKTPTVTLANDKPTTADIFKFDYGPPTSPGLTLGGISPDKATTSTALKPFVLSMPYFIGGPANSQAIAFDAAPAQLYFGKLPYEDYQNSGLAGRLAARSRLEFMAFRGLKDSDPKKAVPSKLAFGYSLSLLDASDPFFARSRFDKGTTPFTWKTCVDAQIAKYRQQLVATPLTVPDMRFSYAGFAGSLQRTLEGQPPVEQAKTIAAYRDKIEALLAHIANLDAATEPTKIKTDGDAKIVKAREAILTARASVDQLSPGARGSALRSLDEALAALSTTAVSPAPSVPDARTLIATLEAHREALNTEANQSNDANNGYATQRAKDIGYTAAVQTCADYANGWARLAPAIDVGFGKIWNGENGKFKEFSSSGEAVWIGARYPLFPIAVKPAANGFADPSKAWAVTIGGSARFGWHEMVATGDTTVPKFDADTRNLWIGTQLLGPDMNLGLQYGWYRAKARDLTQDVYTQDGHQWLLSAARRVGGKSSGTWVNLSYGRATGTTTLRHDKTLLLTVSFSPPKSQDVFAQSASPSGGGGQASGAAKP